MYDWLKGIFVGLVVIIGFSACSASESTSTASNDRLSPAWYSPSGFSSDSLGFYGYATAVSSDSVISVANAELQARANLESAISRKLENVREQMGEAGSDVANQSAFILTLRNAHQAVETEARSVAGSALSQDGYYRGYAQVSISRADLMSLLESGFRGNSSYWQALSGSAAFSQELN